MSHSHSHRNTDSVPIGDIVTEILSVEYHTGVPLVSHSTQYTYHCVSHTFTLVFGHPINAVCIPGVKSGEDARTSLLGR